MRFLLCATWIMLGVTTGYGQTVTVTSPLSPAKEAGVIAGSFRLERTGPTSAPLTVQLSYSGEAVPGMDYEPMSSAATIPAGASFVEWAVEPVNDGEVETAPESVVATVVPGAGYTVGQPSTASVSILSDETATNVSPFLHTTTAVSPTSIRVEWMDNFDNETRFRLQRAPAGTSSWTSTDLPPNTTSHTFTGLTEGTAYDFRVSAWTNGNATSSPNSAVVRQMALAPAAGAQATTTFESWRRDNGLAGGLRATSGRAGDDPDGDHKPNLVEYLLGTSPLNPDPTNLGILPDGPGYLLTWPENTASVLDASLLLQETTDLSQPWAASPLITSLVNGFRSVSETRGGAVRFYRLAAFSESPVEPSDTLVCWGDSLTGNPGTYAEILRSGTELGTRSVINCGIGGDVSQQIRDRLVGLQVSEPFPASMGQAPPLSRVVASRTLHTRIMSPSYRGQWAGYSATVANVSRVEFFNFGSKIGESSTRLSANVTSQISGNASRLLAAGHPFEDGMVVHFPAGPLPSPLVAGKTYIVRDADAGGFALVETDTLATVTANSTSPSSRFVSAGHPFQNGGTVHFPSAPAGMMADTLYYVRDADSGGFSLATSPGGPAVSLIYNFGPGSVRGRPGLTPVNLAGNFAAPTRIEGPFVLEWNHPGGPVSITLRTHTDRDRQTFIFWMGRNNSTRPHETLAHLRSAVEQIKSLNGRFLILSVTNGANEYYGLSGAPYYYPTILLNTWLRREFPNEFVDVRSALLRAASGNVQDQTDRANDIPPTSLRSDAVHFNSAGQQIIAEVVAAELARRGW